MRITPKDGISHTRTEDNEWVIVYSDILILKLHNDGNKTSSLHTIETFETEGKCDARIKSLGFKVPLPDEEEGKTLLARLKTLLLI